MRRFLIVLILASVIFSRGVNGAELGEVTVRLNSQKTQTTPLPILVLVKTNSLAVETFIKLLINNSWTINNSVAVSTSNLPAGVIPLPINGDAIKSGQSIIQNCGDLTPGVLYGFFIVDGIGIIPSPGDYVWQVETDGDSQKINIPVVTSDSVNVKGVVGAKVTDFQLDIGASDTVVYQKEVVTYKIRYGSFLKNYTRPLRLEATWSLGTVEGSPLATVEGLGYVVGSASNGYGGAVAVVDIVNRKIIWTINSFPAETTDEEVTFSLKANENYTGSADVNYEIKAELMGANVVTKIDGQQLKVKRLLVPGQTTEVLVSATPGPNISSVGLTQPELTIDSIDIGELLTSQGRIEVNTNIEPDQIIIRYGTGVNGLNKKITSVNKITGDWFDLENLIPGKTYYFQVEVIKGNTEVESDIYTFRPPKEEPSAIVETQSLTVISDNILITDVGAGGEPNVVLPKEKVYTVKVNIKSNDCRELIIIVRKEEDVLGVTTVYGLEPSSMQSYMVQATGKAVATELVSPKENGYYGVYLRIYENNGTITETKIANLKVTDPIRVTDGNNKPVEGASVLISKFDDSLKVFKNLPSQYKGFPNPGKTNPMGIWDIPLSTGRYKVEVEAFGFLKNETEFNVGIGSRENLPLIRLQAKSETVIRKISNLGLIGHDILAFTREYIVGLNESERFFEFMKYVSACLLLVLGLLVLQQRIGMPWWLLGVWVIFLLNKKKTGKVVDMKTKERIEGAVVYIDRAKYRTNKFGEFEMVTPEKNNKICLNVLAMHYYSREEEYSKEAWEMKDLTIGLEKIRSEDGARSLGFKELGELLGGIIVLMNLIWQILFILARPMGYTFPYLLIAIINMGLWTMLVVKMEKEYVA